MATLKLRLQDIICYEDEHIIAINKPPHIPSLHERHNTELPSIIQLVKDFNSEYALCHRLDKETSGILLIAKNKESHRHMSLQFEKRTIHKTYHALIHGSIDIPKLDVTLPLFTDSKRCVLISKSKGKESKTTIRSIRQFKNFTLLECTPHTGRLHQIRIHCASQNLPLVGDVLYNGKPAYLHEIKHKIKKISSEDKCIFDRVALHAFSIQFTLMNNEQITLQAPYPKDFEVILKLLEKFN